MPLLVVAQKAKNVALDGKQIGEDAQTETSVVQWCGALAFACILEAVKMALPNANTKYSSGSVLNRVLLHQTIIGLSFPFIREKLPGNINSTIRVVEPVACPFLTKGGLCYHGMAPLIPHVYNMGLVEALAIPQIECFQGAVLFARTEKLIPTPELTHAIAATIKEGPKLLQHPSLQLLWEGVKETIAVMKKKAVEDPEIGEGRYLKVSAMRNGKKFYEDKHKKDSGIRHSTSVVHNKSAPISPYACRTGDGIDKIQEIHLEASTNKNLCTYALPTPVGGRSTIVTGGVNNSAIESTTRTRARPMPLRSSVEKVPLLRSDAPVVSDSKRIKGHAHSGPLIGKSYSRKSVVCSSGPLPSLQVEPSSKSGHVSRCPKSCTYVSPKISPSLSPHHLSPPRITSLIARRSQEPSTVKMPGLTISKPASPIPPPLPGLVTRSLSIPSFGQRGQITTDFRWPACSITNFQLESFLYMKVCKRLVYWPKAAPILFLEYLRPGLLPNQPAPSVLDPILAVQTPVPYTDTRHPTQVTPVPYTDTRHPTQVVPILVTPNPNNGMQSPLMEPNTIKRGPIHAAIYLGDKQRVIDAYR
eukprot:Gb_28750 [translate_table: standard]